MRPIATGDSGLTTQGVFGLGGEYEWFPPTDARSAQDSGLKDQLDWWHIELSRMRRGRGR